MIQSKNLKLKLGLCGLALTSFLALNSRSVVHADTVDANQNNAITWDSDQDDSQVVKEEPQQDNSSQSVQTQGAVQNQNTSAVQSVQANSQNRAEKSAVRVANFDTSVVNRNSAQNARPQANVKVATVHDTAQMPVQKQKVAQFNQGSKIYTLNGSNQLSKNNGDGYVITNAGMYNGRPVDIGVTINNVQDNQGSYTTKWSNGDAANVTGKVDNQFDYQNSVLAGSKSVTPQLNQTRPRIEKQTENVDISGVWISGSTNNWEEDGDTGYDRYEHNVSIITPALLKQIMEQVNVPLSEAISKFGENEFDYSKLVSCHANITDKTYVDKYYVGSTGYSVGVNGGHAVPNGTRNFLYHVSFNKGVHVSDLLMTDQDRTSQTYGQKILDTSLFEWPIDKDKNLPPLWANGDTFPPAIDTMTVPDAKFDANEGRNSEGNWTSGFNNVSEYDDESLQDGPLHQKGIKKTYFDASDLATYKITTDPVFAKLTKDVQVTDYLQADKVTNGSLNYNYTVGLYDAQTGDLITDLKPEYKGKTGATATASSSVMNNAIKNKIQQINQNKATVSYTGTSANDDVAFYQETRQVNPQSTDVNRKAQRVIHVNFPNGKKPASYDGIVDANNDIVQTVTFTRTGTENVVSGRKTYGPWQQHGGFSAVTLPSIPGYTMVTNTK